MCHRRGCCEEVGVCSQGPPAGLHGGDAVARQGRHRDSGSVGSTAPARNEAGANGRALLACRP